MKKRIRILTAFVIASSLFAGVPAYAAGTDSPEAVRTEQKEQEADAPELMEPEGRIPAEGETLCGFTVTAVTDFPQKNAKLVSMEHEKSGAELLWIACGDQDRAATVFFRTDGENDKGIPHVFEHITLSGSGKYPSADLWDEAYSGTYNTYLNASTDTHYTVYKMSSLSEDQLLKLLDFHMDGLTDPLALRDEHPLKREAYRFELEDADSEITVTGAVFNEMEALNAGILLQAERAVLKLLYPGSSMSADTGGFRDDIITITEEELKSYYAKYYHPSNMLLVLYGDLEPGRFLELLDREYFSRYDKREMRIADDKYIPWSGYAEAILPYAAAEGSSAEDSGIVLYAVSLGDISVYDRALMTVNSSLLCAEDSPLTKRIQAEFPNAAYLSVVEDGTREPVFLFVLNGSSEGDGEKFKKAVDEELERIFEEGLPQDNVEGIVNRQRMADVLNAEEPGGIEFSERFGASWALGGDPLLFLEQYKAIERLGEEAESGKLLQLLKAYLEKPEKAVLVEMVPEPGLRERQDAAFRAKLADKKASMTAEEVAELVKDTEEFREWSAHSSHGSLLSSLRAIAVQDLPETVRGAAVTEQETDGVRVLRSEIGNAPYLLSELWLDAAAVEFDEIHDFVFLGELLGCLAAGDYSTDRLETALDTAMYDWRFKAAIKYEGEEWTPHPYLMARSFVLEENIEEAEKLWETVLFATDFSDADRIRYLASSAAMNMAYGYQSDPESLAVQLGIAAADPESRTYEYYAMRLPYLSYLRDVSRMSDTEVRELADRLKALLGKLLNRNGAVLTVIGSEKAMEEGLVRTAGLLEKLDTEEHPHADLAGALSEVQLPGRVAAAVNGSVNYNGIFCRNEECGLAGSGKDRAVLQALYTKHLYPAFRYEIGAYGFKDGLGDRISYLMSSRDPGVKESFEVFDAMGESIGSLSFTQQEVDDAVLNIYSGLAYPLSPLSLALAEIDRIMRKIPEGYAEDTLSKMRSAKTARPSDVADSAGIWASAAEKGARITVGSKAAIEENRELYDLVLDDLLQ